MPPRADETPACVVLTLRVESLDALALRRALHGALGDDLGVYAMAVDHAHGRTTVQLSTTVAEMPQVMDRIMRRVPAAEFGAIRVATNVAVH
ncbi:hypothetical protein [Schauerella aestuarii]|uniref:hypothetical protein n=1 Tax=Schauerella aestuarii TaxID=2511204 RepID=UPI00136DA6EA|nr:hypothetical protein [Achromobacter aestuarii]MYZ44587.1 hypothetical protein [Achromobacter aestuarii]